ncbi:N-acetylglucosamine-6-phosphate deacetylase [Paenibacillus piri]|uniref:N-acetylglucosamine-6-phosphate deacetylase n=1 Tax=Paenibacillus piri TaxID=2547395 RepID=A0A4R5KM25_9BACL|nr:N-acetylglucosamine-6-phosphate deacetylase [Paenibacillus piri]TDF95560.1 N-acetylglucosamine-6-phosphate deacetylase [Paenibacillus piri]
MNGEGTVIIRNVHVVTPEGVIEHGWVRLTNGLIDAIGREKDATRPPSGENAAAHTTKLADHAAAGPDASTVSGDDGSTVTIDGRRGWALPGFIDIHVHGGYGHDFMEADAAGLDAITRFHALHGTSVMLATTVTAPKADIDQVLNRVNRYRDAAMPYAQLLGVHLEGPFISAKWPGAQNPAHIVAPQPAWLEDWTRRFPGLIRMQTLAPESEGALPYIEALTREGIIAALGHTDATYEQVQLAVKHGLSHAVHTFNAMRGLHHREPGTVGAVMDNPAIMAEVIADGHHVHPAAIGLLAQLKGPDSLLLITDAISAAGLGNGDYRLGGLDVVVRDGVARLKEGDSLAGSTLTMIDAFRYAVQKAGISVEHASRMASGSPARRLGIDRTTGSLQPGKQADVLLLNAQLELERVWIQGRAIN